MSHGTMLIFLRNNILDKLSYKDACMIMIIFHLLDMLSTDIVLYHGSSNAVETNAIAASAHGGFWIILFRIMAILVTYTSLKLAKLSEFEVRYTSQFSYIEMVTRKNIGLKFVTQAKIGTILVFGIISFARLFAAFSNFSGEIFGLSVTIFVERFFGIESTRSIGAVSAIILSLMSLFAICFLWENFRRGKISSDADPELSNAIS